MALIEKLEAIGDAIRAKNGEAGKYTLDGMVTAIGAIETGGGGGGADVEPIELSGSCEYSCVGKLSSELIKLYGDKVSTNDITGAANMFYYSELERIPFALNFKSTTTASMANMFDNAVNLKEIPAINNAYPKVLANLFSSCYNIRYLPEDLGVNWNWREIQTYNYAGIANVFSSCYSLRKIPEYFLNNLWGVQTSATYSHYKYMINSCYTLDEINNIGIAQSTLTSNCFSSTFYHCDRLKNATFATNEDGTPKTANWKGQTIDLSSYVGYVGTAATMYNFNSGITAADKAPTTDYATFQAFIDANPDNWWTSEVSYSRYTHDSAVNTINSLPDTSAYLASAGGTNTIKFKGQSGAGRGLAINKLTAEEIAVATAKGWTVTLA